MKLKALFFYILICFVYCQKNNVCKKYSDYATKQINKNCWHNPDVDSTPSEMVRRNGYPFISYNVTTEDGYILSLFRIPHGKLDANKKRRQPVYLQHGIFVTSAVWIDTGNRSLAFFLADNGFDVWLGNARGTRYSPGHIKYTMEDPEYWNFTYHEIGLYDLPVSLNFIKKRSGAGKGEIIFIGHSMGTTTSFVYSILKKEEAEENLAGLIATGPIAFMGGLRTPVKYLAYFSDLIKTFLTLLGQYGLVDNPRLQQLISQYTCGTYPTITGCKMFLFIYLGVDMEQLLPEDIPVIFSYAPAGASVKNIVHFAQEIRNGKFQFYDYENLNMEYYGSPVPPEYNLSKISLPVHLMYGRNDFLADEEDVLRLYEALQTKKSVVHLPESENEVPYNHLDFVYSKDIVQVFYPVLLEKINSLRIY